MCLLSPVCVCSKDKQQKQRLLCVFLRVFFESSLAALATEVICLAAVDARPFGRFLINCHAAHRVLDQFDSHLPFNHTLMVNVNGMASPSWPPQFCRVLSSKWLQCIPAPSRPIRLRRNHIKFYFPIVAVTAETAGWNHCR